MMARVCLVACVQGKVGHPARAEDLYTSPLFRKARDFARRHFDRWFILSAEYGLLDPARVVEPYEKTLNRMPRAERRRWSETVFAELARQCDPGDEITVIAGQRYREGLVPLLLRRGHRVHVPMEGMPIGRQLQWLTEHTR